MWKTWLKFGVLAIIIYGALYFLIEPYTEDALAKYRYRRDKQATIENYYENQKAFEELLAFCKTKNLQPLRFNISGKSKVKLSLTNLESSLVQSDIFYHFEFDDVGGYKNWLSCPYTFDNEERLKIYSKWREFNFDSLITCKKWRIEFDGKTSDPFFQEILKYRKWSLDDFQKVCDLLKKINCDNISVFEKGEISFWYISGDVFSGFSYTSKLPDWLSDQGYKDLYLPKKLSNNFYWDFSPGVGCFSIPYYLPN